MSSPMSRVPVRWIERSSPASVAFVVLVIVVSMGCSGLAGPLATPPAAAATVPPRATTSASATAVGSQELRGSHVHVLGLWSGPEFESFQMVRSAWEKQTGAIVDWEASDDLAGSLADDLQAGTPPDVAILPNLALMEQLADDGTLVPLDDVLDMDAIARDYPPAWIELGSHAGKLYGIFYKATNKATVWHSPTAFAAAGYEVPATWKAMVTLADKMVADGRAPFSIVAPSGPATGWALTDWISEIVLNACGPGVYDKWVASEVPWDQACIKRSFEMFLDIVSSEGYVLGGTDRILATGDDVAADALYTDPPTAYLCYLASFAQAFIAAGHPELRPGSDYDVFPFPSIDPAFQGAVTVGADVPVMVTDTSPARSFMTYLAGAAAQEAWIEQGGFTSVNRTVAAGAYRDPVGRTVADELRDAKIVRFSAGDMMPTSLQRAWWSAMVDLVRDPARLDEALDTLTDAARSAG